MRYAKRLQTSDKRAKEAMSATAVRARISISISDGIDPIGQGAAAEGREPWISGLVGKMEKEEKEAMRSGIVPEKATGGGGAGGVFSSEWCAGLGTVGEALEGLTMAGFDLFPTDDGGKYFVL